MISKPWDFANFKILYTYFKCVFNILLYCFMLLICDTKINNNNKTKHMILWRNIENYPFLNFESDPRFPHFYYMLGGNLWSLLYGDVSVMMIQA